MRRALLTLGAVVLAVLAGCTVPLNDDDLGKENGYRYDDQIAVDFGDGLNGSEQEAVVNRAMARIERIRGVEFTETVPVTVVPRAEYRNRSDRGVDGNLSDTQLWNEQVWEGLFAVGENTTYPQTQSTNRGSSVVGYYSANDDEIVLISDTETPKVDRDTLVHELVHALQDQQRNLGTNPQFQDGQFAQLAVTEGDANYVERLYRQRCGAAWSCIPVPERTGGGRPADFNRALFVHSIFPYTEGPRFIDAIRSRSGWAAVDDLYGDYPDSTEQVIHPARYPDDDPAEVTLPDRSGADWTRFDIDRPAHDVIGEGSIYAMFLGSGVIDRSGATQYDYDHPVSEGWTGDRLVPYRDGDRYGYVWRTRWDSPEDAREFADAYRELLDSEGARPLGDGRYRIDDGPYADAFSIRWSGSTVTIVNGPRRTALEDIHAPP